MKKLFQIVIVLIFSAIATYTMAETRTRHLGGDISMMPIHQQQGVIYKDINGQVVNPYELLEQQGWDMMRVRLFVDPQNASANHHDEGVAQDLSYVISLARTIKQQGFDLMLDFHYSDTWADPGKQFTPQRWMGLNATRLADSIYHYTCDCLTAMVKAGVAPDMIQVGNEITFGMDWPIGRIDPMVDDNWDVFTSLLKAGVRACRQVCPQAQLIIHTEKAGQWPMTRSYYRHLQDAGVDYDIIGLSYYPMWHKTIPNLGATLDSLAAQFPNKPVMIVETAYYYQHDGKSWDSSEDFAQCPPGTIEGQRQFTAQLVEELNHHDNVIGLFWWYPEENTFGTQPRGHGGLNRGLFNSANGCALPALYELSRFSH